VEPTEITAGALHLRPFQPWDAAEVLAACQDPEIPRWTRVSAPYTAEHARSHVEKVVPQGWADGTAATFAVLDATTAQLPRQWSEGVAASLAVEEDGRVVGLAVLMAATARSAPEAGWWTMPAARGRGVATRAAGLLAEWAGYRREGVLRSARWTATAGPGRRPARPAAAAVAGAAQVISSSFSRTA
jgi:RimJ/RimL family protein N-acetyltransferase